MIIGWVLAIVTLTGAALSVGASFESATGGATAVTGEVVWQGDDVLAHGHNHIDSVLTKVGQTEGVVSVASPFDHPGQVSADGRTAYAVVTFGPNSSGAEHVVTDILESESAKSGLTQAAGGQAFAGTIAVSEITEIVGVTGALIILVVMFRSAWAALLPIVTGAAGVVAGLMAAMLLSNVVPLPDSTPTLGALIGLGVGIDYALFITYRFRRELMRGAAVDVAVGRAVSTSGRAVVFAAATVIVGLLGMTVLGVQTLTGMAIGAALTVLLTLVAALTLLPALLSVAGRKALSAAQRERIGDDTEAGVRTRRWVAFVERRPVVVAISAAAVMALVAIPALSLRLGAADAGSAPESTSRHQAYDMLAEGFGVGINGPLTLLIDAPDPAAEQAYSTLISELPHVPGVARVTESQVAPGRAVVTVTPQTGPSDERTEDLVEHLRAAVIPSAAADTSLRVTVTGAAVGGFDFADTITDKLPILVASCSSLGCWCCSWHFGVSSSW
ncbi:MMPL family transporter [Gordonia sp. NPDC003950]